VGRSFIIIIIWKRNSTRTDINCLGRFASFDLDEDWLFVVWVNTIRASISFWDFKHLFFFFLFFPEQNQSSYLWLNFLFLTGAKRKILATYNKQSWFTLFFFFVKFNPPDFSLPDFRFYKGLGLIEQ
jgi:hypothetical protein